MKHKAGWYISKHDDDSNVTLYGPFASQLDGARAAYFLRPTTERDDIACRRTLGPNWKGALRGYQVHKYDADELEMLVDEPEALDYNSVTVIAAADTPRHESWAALGDFAEELRDEDLAD